MDGSRSGRKRDRFAANRAGSMERLEPRRLLTAGQLDPSFGSDGSVFAGNYPDFSISAIAVQPDGKVLAAGNGGTNNTSTSIERFNVDGSLDPSFGTGGKVSISISGVTAFVNKILVETSGKILCVGNTQDSNGNDDMAMARLNADGSFDSSFGTAGKIAFDAGGNDDELTQAAQSINNTIVIAGSSGDTGSGNAFVARIHDSNGSFDTSFSGDGKASIDFNSLNDNLTGMTVSSSGVIEIATESTGYVRRLGLARLTATGSLDTSFSGDGKNTDTDFIAAGIFPASGGQLLVLGLEPGSTAQIQMRRFNSDGSVDKTFGTSGRVDITQLNVFSLSNAVEQADGKIILAGNTETNSVAGSFVMRVTSSGGIDSTFTPPVFLASNGHVDSQMFLAIGADQRSVLADESFDGTTTPPTGSSTIIRMQGDNSPILDDGILSVKGTSADDSIILGADSTGVLAVSINSGTTAFDLADLKSISISGGDGDDSIVLTAIGNLTLQITVDGGTGDDIILGSASAETLGGGIGDDTIHGAGGDDQIDGGAGNDQLFGERGNDQITGGAGMDNLSGGSGNDTLMAGDGEADTVSGDAGIDLADYSNETANLSLTLDGLANDGAPGENDNLLGIENIYGGSGNDRITGSDGDNFLYGNGGNDTIHGGSGNDTLKGGSGHDHLFGDGGTDLLIANDHTKDILDGGNGSDTAKDDVIDVVTSVESLV